MSTFNTATQTSAPPWVRSRAVAMHTVSALGSFAIGSALLGRGVGVRRAGGGSGRGPCAWRPGILLARPFPLRMGEAHEVTPASRWEDLFVVDEPPRRTGPVAVEIAYRIRAGEAEEFLDAVTLAARAAAARRRDLLAHLPRPGGSVAVCGALHRHLLGGLPAPARARHAGRSGSGGRAGGVPGGRQAGDSALRG